MIMGRDTSSVFLLMALALIKPGCTFLFKQSMSDSDRPNSIAHLKRRYWNDDIQPCIEKFCLDYLGEKTYVKCLQHFCPAGLLAVPRDLEAMSYFPIAFLLGETEFCTDDFIANSHSLGDNFDPNCSSGQCTIDNMLSGAQTGGDPMMAFKYGVYTLCRASLCADSKGSAHYDCVRERCCGQSDEETHKISSTRKRALDMLASPSSVVARKRRVGDDVSQCIQSYCGDKQPRSTARMFCIASNCNRGK